MTANVLVLCAAGMLVTAYLMVGQKALFTTIRLFGVQSAAAGHRGRHERDRGWAQRSLRHRRAHPDPEGAR